MNKLYKLLTLLTLKIIFDGTAFPTKNLLLFRITKHVSRKCFEQTTEYLFILCIFNLFSKAKLFHLSLTFSLTGNL